MWVLARRSAAYSAELKLAEEEKRALEEMNLVAAGLAHEIKNPLSVIRGLAQRLAGEKDEQRRTEATNGAPAIVEEIDRVTSRINELLAFARTTPADKRPVSVRALVLDLDRLLHEDLSEAGLRLRVPETDCTVAADPEQFRQLLFNLLHNAMRFAPGTGEIEVHLEPEDTRHCRLIIRDHGPGIPDGLEQKVFSPYFTTVADGTGLGLAIVRRIVRAHGWKISCRNDGGAVFRIEGLERTRPGGRAGARHGNTEKGSRKPART